jgi:hypothetical protein
MTGDGWVDGERCGDDGRRLCCRRAMLREQVIPIDSRRARIRVSPPLSDYFLVGDFYSVAAGAFGTVEGSVGFGD